MCTARSSGRLGVPASGGVSPRHSRGQTPWEQAPPRAPGPATPWNQAPPPHGQTHTCKHFTLPQTSSAGGNNLFSLRNGFEIVGTKDKKIV